MRDVEWGFLREPRLWGVFDVELTNRCNASCAFCPRDLTPGQGIMGPEVFERTLDRITEFTDLAGDLFANEAAVSFCGLGEQLLNRHVSDYVADVRRAGLHAAVTSNASLLDEPTSQALIDAGLNFLFVNGGERDEAYEDVYHLPFDRTRDNVVRFRDMTGGHCAVVIVLVDHRDDPDHIRSMRRYWTDLGFEHFMPFHLQNRGGSLVVESQVYPSHPRREQAEVRLAAHPNPAVCPAPFLFPFIGFDGRYYLCSSDWRKEVALGTVFDRSVAEVMAQKLAVVASREPICRTCTHDPVNQLADLLRATNGNEDAAAVVDEADALIRAQTEHLGTVLDRFGLSLPPPTRPAAGGAPARARIPVRAL